MSVRIGSVFTSLLLLGGALSGPARAEIQDGSNPSTRAASTAQGSTWADASKLPDLFDGTWVNLASFVEDDTKLNVPFTAAAQKYVDAYKHKRDIPYAQSGCTTPGLPLAMRLGGPLKFTYTPGLISIYMQSVGDTRFIKMNQKSGITTPKYYGTSVGHWEGDTIVVETSDFLPEVTFQYGVGKALPSAETLTPGLDAGSPQQSTSTGPVPAPADIQASLSAAIWGPPGEGMHMVERMRLIDSETMEHKLTIYDDTVWTKPYVMTTRNYRRIRPGQNIGPFGGDPEEYVCTVSITNFDPTTNEYIDRDPEEMVKFLESRKSY